MRLRRIERLAAQKNVLLSGAYAGVIFKDLRRAVPYASRGDADGHSWADRGAGCELLNRFGTLSTQTNLSGINRDKVNYYFQSLKPALLSI